VARRHPLPTDGRGDAPHVARLVNAERLVVLGWPRAILLQLAHPLVAAGVAEHSSFRRSRRTAVVRLHHTIRAMLALVFGDDERRRASLDGIRAIHRRVHGRLREAAGPFASGTPYSAEDPDLVLWVHATLLESLPLTYRTLVGPLTAEQLDAYCAESASVAEELGARRSEVPRTWHDTLTYLDRGYRSGIATVSAEAREVAAAVLSRPFGIITRPLAVGLLPDSIRAQYGFRWSASQQSRLDAWCSAARKMRYVMPRSVALWPEAL
jgi:uncharacterized protein (DUF2236 family)